MWTGLDWLSSGQCEPAMDRCLGPAFPQVWAPSTCGASCSSLCGQTNFSFFISFLVSFWVDSDLGVMAHGMDCGMLGIKTPFGVSFLCHQYLKWLAIESHTVPRYRDQRAGEWGLALILGMLRQRLDTQVYHCFYIPSLHITGTITCVHERQMFQCKLEVSVTKGYEP